MHPPAPSSQPSPPSGAAVNTILPPAAASGANAWSVPVAALAAILGVAFVVIGLLALASSADTEALTRVNRSESNSASSSGDAGNQNEAKQNAANQSDGTENGASDSGSGGFGQDVYARPDPVAEVDGFRVDCLEPGVCSVTSRTGEQLFFADEGTPLPPGVGAGDGNVLVPDPNGDIAGFKVNADGTLELVPQGEEDGDTYSMGFGADGSVEVLRPGQAPGYGRELVPSTPGQRSRTEPLPNGGRSSATIETENGSLDIECLDNICRVITPAGDQLALSPFARPGGSGDDLNPDGPGFMSLVPDPDGDIVGFRLNADGELELVRRGEETEDMIGLVFGADGSVELLENGQVPGLGTELRPRVTNEGLGDLPDWDPDAGDDGSILDWFGRWTIALGAALILLGVAIAVVAARRRRPDVPESGDLESLDGGEMDEEVTDEDILALARNRANAARVDAVDHLLDGLRSEPDPRRAIQEAYAAMETGFGNANLARRPTDTPADYIDRTLGHVASAREPLFELTGLFELARFSAQPVTEHMRARAIEALTEIRAIYQVPVGSRA